LPDPRCSKLAGTYAITKRLAQLPLLPKMLSLADNDSQRHINKFFMGISRLPSGVEISHDEF
jgi:hypothetical protein